MNISNKATCCFENMGASHRKVLEKYVVMKKSLEKERQENIQLREQIMRVGKRVMQK